MEIRVNGETTLYGGRPTVTALLESLGVRPGTVVVEKNRRIVPRGQMEYEPVTEGDAIEIVRLVRGG
jgi:thiamine biosynthesis protein ThiS